VYCGGELGSHSVVIGLAGPHLIDHPAQSGLTLRFCGLVLGRDCDRFVVGSLGHARGRQQEYDNEALNHISSLSRPSVKCAEVQLRLLLREVLQSPSTRLYESGSSHWVSRIQDEETSVILSKANLMELQCIWLYGNPLTIQSGAGDPFK